MDFARVRNQRQPVNRPRGVIDALRSRREDSGMHDEVLVINDRTVDFDQRCVT